MANIEDCPGFESFGEDVKAARKARRLTCPSKGRGTLWNVSFKAFIPAKQRFWDFCSSISKCTCCKVVVNEQPGGISITTF